MLILFDHRKLTLTWMIIRLLGRHLANIQKIFDARIVNTAQHYH